MTDMKVDELGFRFTYLLPFSERQALVEETRFSCQTVSRDRLHSDLDATLATLVTGSVEKLRTEAGCIPMTTERASSKGVDRVVRAGTTGGAVRASSGYAFFRIHTWAARCADQVRGGGGPIAHPAEPAWRSAVDRLFLRVLRVQPELTPSLFMSMGRHLSAKTMVRFLSDDCRPRDFLRVAGVLPKRPFLRELMLSLKEGQLL
jgi:lycopene beta-cyclase